MKLSYLYLLACLVWSPPDSAWAQTRLKLANVLPGSENVQLVFNGDFQFQGPATATNTHPFPTGWARVADIYADAGTNLVTANAGAVARALASGGAASCQYRQVINLAPNTDYVLSAYLWNMGEAANRVTTVVDLSDAPQEPQFTLAYSDATADLGYFVYRSFNTGITGSNVTLRIFYDGLTGSGAAARHWPLAAQWDNVAITRAADFVPPQSAGSGANLRPAVRLTSPSNGTNVVASSSPAMLTLAASASDYDGTITNVEFYAGGAKLGEVSASPYALDWAIPASGSYTLTAVATDNRGATTVSAPVAISASITIPPAPIRLSFVGDASNLILSWPASVTALSLQSASNLTSPILWRNVTNTAVVVSNQNVVTVPMTGSRQFYRLGPGVDPGTLDRKLMMGYQGWFACPGDGSAQNSWVHWFGNNTPTADNAHFDFWPDTSELDADELFSTSMTYSNGSPARLYSAYKQKTVVRHFKWMQENNLDGVFFQRFLSDLPGGGLSALRDQVAVNVRVGAETYGRVFAIMYDISGYSTNTLVSKLTNDWLYLVNTQRVTNSPAYLHHHGKPVVAIWGFGFSGRSDTPQHAQQAIGWFKAAGCTVMGGLPTHWRTLTGDAQTNPAWSNVFRSFDVISPWSVGRYGNTTEVDNFRVNQILPDLADCTSHGIDYLPVIFPGFSWTNLNSGPFNQIKRNGGNFYWRQAYNAVRSGCTMMYGAMFDEVDEGTAMYKLAPTAAQLPAQGTFVPLNIDGYNLRSDWYLRLADQAGKMLRGEIPITSAIPITPP